MTEPAASDAATGPDPVPATGPVFAPRPSPAADPDLAEPGRQVAQDRAELARTVEALAGKANVPARSRRWLDDVRRQVSTTLRGRGAAAGLVVSAALAVVLRAIRARRR